MPKYNCELWSEIHRVIILESELSHVKNVSISITSRKVGGIETPFLVIKDTRNAERAQEEEFELQNVKIPPETGERLYGQLFAEALMNWRLKQKELLASR